MPYFFALIALLSALYSPPGFAAKNDCAHLWARIGRIYSHSFDCNYVSGNCFENALKLAKRLLAEPGIDPQDLHVAYIFPHKNGPGTIYARGGRSGSEEWRYHVIVIYKGQVMDHDFGTNAAIKSVSDYVEEMFEKKIADSDMIEGQHLFEFRSDAQVRLIPAKEYAEETVRTYTGTLDFRHYVLDPKGKYPAMRIQEFIQRFSEK